MPKTNTGGKQAPRARKRPAEILDLAAEQARTERGARQIKALFDHGNGVPDFICSAVMVALQAAYAKTEIDFWQAKDGGGGPVMGDDFNLKGLTTLLTVTDSRDIELEPKKDLAEMLSAVLRHPKLPTDIYNGIGDAVCSLEIDCDAPEYIRLALANREPVAVTRCRRRAAKGGK